jgi:uncharacterized membrane protein HdeD (DUF308 family)
MTAAATPGWLRALRITFGLIAIVASFYVLSSPGFAVYTLVLLLSLAMIMIGMSRLARGLSHRLFSKAHRVIDVVAGVLGIILGFAVLSFPLMGAVTLIFLLAFATMVYGFGSVVIGAMARKLAKWVRGLLVIAGLLAVVFSFIVFAEPAIGAFTLIVILSVSLMVHGIESILSAI